MLRHTFALEWLQRELDHITKTELNRGPVSDDFERLTNLRMNPLMGLARILGHKDTSPMMECLQDLRAEQRLDDPDYKSISDEILDEWDGLELERIDYETDAAEDGLL